MRKIFLILILLLVLPYQTFASEWETLGDVVGPPSSTDNAIPRLDGITGKLLQDTSFLTADDDGKSVLTSTLNDATGNETAFTLNYTTNKATSGIDHGLKINWTDTLSPATVSYPFDVQKDGTSILCVDGTNGNVGIGTTGPEAQIDVKNNQRWHWSGEPSSYYLHLTNSVAAGNVSWNLVQKNFPIEYNVLTFMNGNVGIGTTNPQSNLDVVNTIRITDFYTDASNYESYSLDAGVTTVDTLTIKSNTAGTGVDDLNIALTPAGNGAINLNSHVYIGNGKAFTSFADGISLDLQFNNRSSAGNMIKMAFGTATFTGFDGEIVGVNIMPTVGALDNGDTMTLLKLAPQGTPASTLGTVRGLAFGNWGGTGTDTAYMIDATATGYDNLIYSSVFNVDNAGTVTNSGARIVNVTTVNAATYDLLVTDNILNVTYTTTAAVTSLTLPTAQLVSGRIITVKDAGYNAGTFSITIDTEGTEKINNGDTYVINANGNSVSIYSDGTNWHIY